MRSHPVPEPLQAALDRFAAQRVRLAHKRQNPAQRPPIGPQTRLSPVLGRPVQVGEALRYWWADPEK